MESGVVLSAKYALPPNSRAYCGEKSFQKTFKVFLAGTASASSLEAELKKFRVQHAYLRLIARCSGRKPFDCKVTEAFWIGNGLLECVSASDLKRFVLRDLCAPGLLSPARAKKIAGRVSHGCSPHHSFHALFVGSASRVVKPTLANATKCLVRWGRVASSADGTAVVFASPLAEIGGRVVFGKPARAQFFSPFERLRKNDDVSLHWDFAVEKLSQQELGNLKKWTLSNLDSLNGA